MLVLEKSMSKEQRLVCPGVGAASEASRQTVYTRAALDFVGDDLATLGDGVLNTVAVVEFDS